MAALSNLVRMTSTTTGTGTVTLGSAVQGFLTPAQSGMVDGRVYSYAIEADYITVGDDLVPTSREVGTGTYTAAGTTLTRSVVKSTNGNALLNLAGDEQVFVTLLASNIRELLTASRSIFVRTTGSDSNSGLTSSSPFLTIQKAWDTITSILDVGGQLITVDIGAGTFDGPILSTSAVGGGVVTFQGASAATTTVRSTASGAAFQVNAPQLVTVLMGGITITDPQGLDGIAVNASCIAGITGNDVIFGASVGNAHISLSAPGAFFSDAATAQGWKVQGNGDCHLQCIGPGTKIRVFGQIVTSGTLTFTNFVDMQDEGYCKVTTAPSVASGSVTGTRYSSKVNAAINTNGGGASFFPGTVAGTTATGGQYV